MCAVNLKLLDVITYKVGFFLSHVCVFMLQQDSKHLEGVICQTFIFCYLWALGGNVNSSHWDAFDTFVREQFEDDRNAKVCAHPQLRFLYCTVTYSDRTYVHNTLTKSSMLLFHHSPLPEESNPLTNTIAGIGTNGTMCKKASRLAHIIYCIKVLLALDISSWITSSFFSEYPP